MTMLLFVALTVALSITVDAESLLNSGRDAELVQYRERVILLHELIDAECAHMKSAVSAVRRQLSYDELVDQTDLIIEKQLYAKLRSLYVQCQLTKPKKLATRPRPPKPTSTTTTTTMPTSTTTPTTTTPTTTTPTTTTPTTTTEIPTPAACFTAMNLTDDWRMDHEGKNIKPVRGGFLWQCDMADMKIAGRPWFRFSMDAGERMLDSCPRSLSCGSAGSIWSDHTTSTRTGDITSIKAYTRYGGNCKHVTWDLSVMRCSTSANDFIYKYDDDKIQCYNAFCGMK